MQLHALSDKTDGREADSVEDKKRHFEEVYVLGELQYLRQDEIVRKAMVERGLKVWGLVLERGVGCMLLREGEGAAAAVV